jgi:hypothetical protein
MNAIEKLLVRASKDPNTSITTEDIAKARAELAALRAVAEAGKDVYGHLESVLQGGGKLNGIGLFVHLNMKQTLSTLAAAQKGVSHE